MQRHALAGSRVPLLLALSASLLAQAPPIGSWSTPGFDHSTAAPAAYRPGFGWATNPALPPTPTPRTYHSTAVLLPDGRVFVAGGDGRVSTASGHHWDFEIYSPHYLQGSPAPVRPVIGSLTDPGGTATQTDPVDGTLPGTRKGTSSTATSRTSTRSRRSC